MHNSKDLPAAHRGALIKYTTNDVQPDTLGRTLDSPQWGVGDQAGSEPIGQQVVGGRVVDLILGEHPHTRQDGTTYARFRGRDSGGEVVGFSGHYRRTGVRVEEYNYLKTSHLSGDEVRRGCKATISIDGVDVYEFGGRELLNVLSLVPAKLAALEDVAIDLTKPDEAIGRKVYFRQHPAMIKCLHDDGTVSLESADGPFPRAPWRDKGDDGSDTLVSEDVLARSIFWFRE